MKSKDACINIIIYIPIIDIYIYISMFNENFDLLAKNGIRVYGIFYLKDYRVFSMHFVEFAS